MYYAPSPSRPSIKDSLEFGKTESFGGWHEVAVTEVERLGAALARQSGQDEDEAVRHLWGKLAILLQRGNAAILANRVPEFPAPAIDGRY